jgi:hypothetical protein
MNLKKAHAWLNQNHQPAYRYHQLVTAISRGMSSYEQITTWPDTLKQQISAHIPFLSYTTSRLLKSQDGHLQSHPPASMTAQ